MPRRGENIYKRKDGRWEARYIYSFKEDGSPRYRSIYAADYLTVKKKQNDAKRKMDPRLFQSVRMKKNISFYGLLWLERLKPSSKESTYVRYHYLFSHYISPMIGDRLVYTFSNKDCEVFLNRLLISGKSDGSGLAPKTVTDIRSVVKLILKTAEKEGELSLCNPELCPVKPVRKPLRILSLKEQQALQDYLLGNLTHKNIGTLIVIRFEPSINRALEYALADGFIAQQANGTYKLMDRGRALVKEILNDDTLFQREKDVLEEIQCDLTEEKIKSLMEGWRYQNVKNQPT